MINVSAKKALWDTHPVLCPFLVFLALSLLMFWRVTPSFWNSVPGTSGDAYLSLFYLWAAPTAILSHTPLYTTTAIFSPIGASIPAATLEPLAGLLTYPIQLLDRAIAYNLLLYLGFVVSALAAYLLAWRVTKNTAAAVLAGVIFAFNPFHAIAAFGSLVQVSIEFIPLLALSLLLLVQERRIVYAASAAISLIFVVFFQDVQPLFVLYTMIVLAVSLAVALGISWLARRRWNTAALFITVIVLVLLEANGIALSYYYGTSTTAVPNAYHQLSESVTNFTMLYLPVLPQYSAANPWYYQELELYYQTIAQKSTVNGYAASINQSQAALISSIPLSVESNYLLLGDGFAYSSPINENYTNQTILALAGYNVGYISVIRSAYNTTDQAQLLSYMDTVFGYPLYQDNSTSIFTTQTAFSAHLGNSIVGVPTGSWVPGYSLCSSQQCSPSFYNMWFGSDARGILLWVPQNISEVSMGMLASSSSSEGLYVSINNQTLRLNLTNATQHFSVGLAVHAGYNPISLIGATTKNASAVSTGYGIENVTFKAVS